MCEKCEKMKNDFIKLCSELFNINEDDFESQEDYDKANIKFLEKELLNFAISNNITKKPAAISGGKLTKGQKVLDELINKELEESEEE